MKIGVISDTHDDIVSVKKFLKIFQDHAIEKVIHLGDFIAPPIVRLFQDFTLIGVFGNNDGYQFGLMKTFDEIGGQILGDFGEVEIDALKIALYHGEFRQVSEALAASGQYDVVFTGHFHRFEIKKYKKTLLLSPGSAHAFFSNDEGPTAAIFYSQDKTFEMVQLPINGCDR
jgi:uncharacterized protein